METAGSILRYWFGAATGCADVIREKTELWWKKQPAANAEIRRRFEQMLAAEMRSEYGSWGDGAYA